MTVRNITNSVSAVGSATIGQVVPFTFPIDLDTDLVVNKKLTATSAETLLDLNSDYTVTVGSTFTCLSGTTDYLYLGNGTKFTKITYAMFSHTGTGALTIQYYNGSTWATLTKTDNTSNFNASGTITFTAPATWATVAVNGSTQYWLRISEATSGVKVAFAVSIDNSNHFDKVWLYTATPSYGDLTTLAEKTATGSSGGSVTTLVSIAATYTIEIVRHTPLTQLLDLVNGGTLDAEALEAEYDKLAKCIIDSLYVITNTLVPYPLEDGKFLTNDGIDLMWEYPVPVPFESGKFLSNDGTTLSWEDTHDAVTISTLGTTNGLSIDANQVLTLSPSAATTIHLAFPIADAGASTKIVCYKDAIPADTAWIGSSHSYTVGDQVIGSDTKYYVCILAHLSADGNAPVTGATYTTKWREIQPVTVQCRVAGTADLNSAAPRLTEDLEISIWGGTETTATITSITRATNVVTVVMSASTNFTVGDYVLITGVADTSFWGSFVIATVASPNITFAQTGDNGTSSGGTAMVSTNWHCTTIVQKSENCICETGI
jgi:hypothetical protein